MESGWNSSLVSFSTLRSLTKRVNTDLVRGEAQRIRLAAQLGSNLQGVCYVLDEDH
jgi:excinuclease UvrABC ATPase subunit